MKRSNFCGISGKVAEPSRLWFGGQRRDATATLLTQSVKFCFAAALFCWMAFAGDCPAMGKPDAASSQTSTAAPGPGGGEGGGALDTAGGVLGNDGVGESMNQGAKNLQTRAGGANIQSRLANYFGDADAGKLQQQSDNLGRASKLVNGGTAVIGHAGWVATAAGTAAEGDYAGAAIQAGSGFGKTLATGWAAVKGGAMGFAVGGPVGAFFGAVGTAWAAGAAYDATVQRGADYLNQKVVDYQTDKNLRGDGSRQGQDISRDTAKNAGQDAALGAVRGSTPPPTPPPVMPPRGGGGGCGGPCGR
ncbi:MAG: hypothetical protein PHV34_12885 [Verrucomicrobiae bacterium]|nr:hypothetical protein [Verrucomicrobiae bacterium]